MKLPAPIQREHGEHILPLINVVFLILIFLMLTATVEPPEPFAVSPPKSLSEAPAGSGEEAVVVSANGRISIAGREIARSALKNNVARMIGQNDVAPVKLKVDANLKAHQLIQVMEDLRAAGAKKLLLLTESSP
ncbi:MAG: biopolymer transporter ExbD [Gammaproteobacteria bacterium]|nr:biopolymer transporter ExbD [Gammaproteobacteria bacterium]